MAHVQQNVPNAAIRDAQAAGCFELQQELGGPGYR
jgi:hypothetical protein